MGDASQAGAEPVGAVREPPLQSCKPYSPDAASSSVALLSQAAARSDTLGVVCPVYLLRDAFVVRVNGGSPWPMPVSLWFRRERS